jgi:glycosyltransferase involved in cell wall biosynthesis
VLSILMPVYDERDTVDQAIDAVLAVELPTDIELIVIDDGSTDGTGELLDRREWPDNARLLRHDRNRGKGAALRTGLEQARGEIATIFDADLEYDPADIGALLPPLLDGRANAVFGVRAFDGFTSHSFLYVLGNKGVTLAANVLFNVYMRDIMTCHKAIRTDVFRGLPLSARGFDIEPEITARLLQSGERIYEVPIRYRARSTEEGKKLTSRDGFRVLRTLLRCRLSGGARFAPKPARAAPDHTEAAGNGSLPGASDAGSSEPLRR